MAANNKMQRKGSSSMASTQMVAVVAIMVAAITTTTMMGVIPNVDAFSPPSSISSSTISKSSQPSSTQLYIIGPLIRKMQGKDKEQQNMPMMDAEEARTEAPGLRVGASAWKWPPVWPYDANFFKRDAEITADKDKAAQNNPMGALMSGGLPKAGGEGEEGEDDGDEVVFDSLKYWADNEGVKTELDERVIEKITK